MYELISQLHFKLPSQTIDLLLAFFRREMKTQVTKFFYPFLLLIKTFDKCKKKENLIYICSA